MTLLDTDTLTLLMQGHARVTGRVARSARVAITVVTRIEVLQGRFASVLKAGDGEELLRAQHWLDESERYLSNLEVVPFDRSAAEEFDRLRRNRKLKKSGRADLLIASIALARGATLVTRNKRHFQPIAVLRIEDWAD